MSLFGCVTLKTLTLAFPPWTASPSGVREAAGDYQHPVAGRLWARFPGLGVGVIVSHTCVKSLCKCIAPALPQPCGWLPEFCSATLATEGSCLCPGCPIHVCRTAVCREPDVAPRSRAHPMLLPGPWRPTSHPWWPQRLKRLHNEGHDGIRAKSMEALEARVEVWGFHPQEKTSI